VSRTEITSSAQVLIKTQPEEFDLVILGSAGLRRNVPNSCPRKLGNVRSVPELCEWAFTTDVNEALGLEDSGNNIVD
jgi:hypothetical protein